MDEKVAVFDQLIHYGISYDIIKKEISVGNTTGYYYLLNGFGNAMLTEQLIAYFTSTDAANRLGESYRKLLLGIPFAEVSGTKDLFDAQLGLMTGSAVLYLDGYEDWILIDTHKFPERGMKEPEKDRTLRGSRDGFVESLTPNTALLRRRIRDPRFVIEKLSVGSRTMTDIAICYIGDLADEAYVNSIKERVKKLQPDGLNMGMESLSEIFVRGYWNPFPKVRYTERPDTACATIMEGGVILLCDNYPSAMLLPTSILDFLQDTDDFYFPPLIGGYLKAVRIVTYLLSVFFTPVWYLFVCNPLWLPPSFRFAVEKGSAALPILVQLFLLEFAIDGLKLASLNTPDSLTNSLSLIGGLLIGDYAVSIGWLSESTILYMAFVAIANFTQPNYELGYSFKLMRLITLVLISLLNGWGLLIGVLLTLLFIITNPTTGGKGYLYPIIPFNKNALKRLLFRVKLRQDGEK